MADSFELAYVYARVCGSLAHSWAGDRALELYRLTRLPDVWKALFGESAPALPEALLFREAQRRVLREALDKFRLLTEALRREEPFFLALRRKSEFARVKRILLAVAAGEGSCPESDDPDLQAGFDPGPYPDLGAMFGGGRYSWIGKESLANPAEAENRLDRQFYGELWDELRRLRAPLRAGLAELLRLEVELENVVWAQRLAFYYRMDEAAILPRLVELPGLDVRSAALASLGFKPQARADWRGWKFEALLGPFREEWSLDVRALESEARSLLYRRIKKALHLHPFSFTPLYCFFKLLEFETAVILGLLEGQRLGAPAEEIAWLALSRKGSLA